MIWRELPVRLTPEEQRLKGEALAKLNAERDRVDAERADVASKYRDQLKGLESKIHDVGREVRECSELRDVECHEVQDAVGGTVSLIRGDTGEVVETGPMRFEERQIDLKAVADTRKAKKSKDAEAESR